jgi:CHAT domain
MYCSDIDLKLGGEQGNYSVELLNSPGSKRSETRPLILPDDVDGWIERVRTRTGDRHEGKRLGKELFNALFPSPIREIWHEARGFTGDSGILRVRLDVRSNELMNIPWEMVHDGRGYRALSRRTPVVRYLHRNTSLRPLQSPRPPNVLLVTAGPRDLPLLNAVDKEINEILELLKTFDAAGKIGRLEILEHATSSKLHAALNAPFDVVHYMGHGAFREGRGYLILEDSERNAHWIEAETISDLVRNTSVRLLLLNACDTAIPSPDESLIGVAHAAHAAGIPAVVAMQQTILDQAAAEFASGFYQAFVALKPLETCLSAGRIAVKAKLGNDSMEWAIPVMFSNAPAGSLYSLWEVAEATPEEPPREAVAEQPSIVIRDNVIKKPKGQIVLGPIYGNATSVVKTKK